jgi:hypothetical protein
VTDRERIDAMLGRVLADAGGAFTVALAYIGDRLGLFRALGAGAATAGELASRTRLHERYVLEWLKAMVAAEYAEFDGERFRMTPEQAAVLADESTPVFLGGAMQFAVPSIRHVPRILEAFRTGGGVSFAELGPEVAEAIDRLHKPWFDHLLVKEWLPGVPGLVARLEGGIAVLDVGCGLGRSTRAVASAFPRSRVTGLDPDEFSITRAREEARGLANAEFVREWPAAARYDAALAIDCVHDMADPVGALRKIRAALSPLHCLTVSLAEGGAGLGTIIGEAGARTLAEAAGFASFERLAIKSRVQQFFLLK